LGYHLSALLSGLCCSLGLGVELEESIDAAVYFVVDAFELLLLLSHLLLQRGTLFLFHHIIKQSKLSANRIRREIGWTHDRGGRRGLKEKLGKFGFIFGFLVIGNGLDREVQYNDFCAF